MKVLLLALAVASFCHQGRADGVNFSSIAGTWDDPSFYFDHAVITANGQIENDFIPFSNGVPFECHFIEEGNIFNVQTYQDNGACVRKVWYTVTKTSLKPESQSIAECASMQLNDADAVESGVMNSSVEIPCETSVQTSHILKRVVR